MSVAHLPKAGATLTGTEWESASTHVVHTATVSDTDPGAIGAGNLWLDITQDDQQDFGAFQLKVRNAADDGWILAGFANAVGAVNIDAWSQDGNIDAYTDHNAGVGARVDIGVNDYGTPRNGIQLTIGGGNPPLSWDRVTLRSQVAGGSQVFASFVILRADPTAGLASGIASLGLRNNSGLGELWLKTGSGSSDWSRIGTQAAFVEPTTATPEDICNALIACGLMAPS